MPVHVDSSLPVHPLSVTDVRGMLRAGIIDPADRIELLDGVLVEMGPQGKPHAYAIRRLVALAGRAIVAEAGLELSVQAPLDVGSAISLPRARCYGWTADRPPSAIVALRPLRTLDQHD